MTAPANDDFADAIVKDADDLSPSPWFFEDGNNTDATFESGEPAPSGWALERTVWFKITSTEEREIWLYAAGAAKLGLAVWRTATDAFGDMVLVESQQATGRGGSAEFTFTLDPALGSYYVQCGPVESYSGSGDWYEVLGSVLSPPSAPDNDNFADAEPITLSGGSATITGTTYNATMEDGEQDTFATFGYAGTITASVWYSWEADADGLARFDTFDSDFNTTAAVFSGTLVDATTCLAFNDDYDGDEGQIEQSQIAWAAGSGQTYYLQVGGEEQGDITGHLYFDPYPTGVTPDPGFDSGTASAYRIELRSLNSAGFDVTTESLELTSFSCNWRLNGPGAFEGTGVIGVTQADAGNVGARELIVYKDDTAIWGGYLSYLDVDEDSRAVRVAAEGYWSRARMRLIRGDQLYKPLTNYGVAWKANVIAWDIIDQAQGASYGDMGWVYGGHSGTRLDCKRIYRGVDRQNVGGAIETLAAEGYFDFSLDVRATPSEGDVAMFRTWRRRGSDLSGSVNLSASNAMQLNYSLSSSDMATVIDVFGSVQGCRGVAATESQNLSTYGRVEATPIDMETDEQSEVDNTAEEFIDQHSIPAKNATVTYLEGVGPDLTDYDLGDTIRVTPGDTYVSYFDARVVGRELAVEAGRAVVTVEVER